MSVFHTDLQNTDIDYYRTTRILSDTFRSSSDVIHAVHFYA